MDYDSLLELLKNRRSIRRFKPDPIPDEYVDKIIEAARWAPSGFNTQPWEFVVVKKPELKNRIVELVEQYFAQRTEMESAREPWLGSPWKGSGGREMDYSTAPIFIVLFGDTRTKLGLPMGVRYNQNMNQTIYLSSLANAFIYMHLAATTLGLASQWVSGVQLPHAHCLIKKLLGIPGEMEIYDMMAVGYPAMKPRPKLMREKAKMIHYDDCGEADFRTDEEVYDYLRKTRTWVMATHSRQAD